MGEMGSELTRLPDPELSLCMAVYGQPKMLGVWWDTVLAYPRELRDKFELVIVDDCGKPPVKIPEAVRSAVRCQLFRVLEDIPWNQPGARNLAAKHARARVLCFLDPDMVIPPQDIGLFLGAARKLLRGRVLRFSLRHAGGRIDTSSPNTWLIRRKDFLSAGGYDEDYSGHKGWSDVQLLLIFQNLYSEGVSKQLVVDYYREDRIPDAQVNSLSRAVAKNKALHLRKLEQMRSVRGWRTWVTKCKGRNLRFKWERVL